jgi:DNA-3-methyladenine glycosylase II
MLPKTRLAKADPVLGALIKRTPPGDVEQPGRERPDDHYGALLRAITGQQLSVKAASAIYNRTIAFFDGKVPTPEQIIEADGEALKAAGGLSRAKVSYLKSLAEHVVGGELELEKMDKLPDEEVLAELTAVKGIGVWTAQMFLMFHLSRPDVLPVGDLGIRRSVMIEYGLPGLPDPAELTEIAEPWRPYRSLACLYLWAAVDAEPEV